MPGISFVTGQVERAIDVNRQIGVDLNHAPVAALIPVVAAPGLVRDVLDGERLHRRKADVGERPGAAFGDGAIEYAREAIARNNEVPAERFVALTRRAWP